MKTKINIKIFCMCLVVCIVAIGSLAIISKAETGNYASLSGGYYTDQNSTQWAYASAKNISNITRYMTVSVKNRYDNVLGSGGGKVSVGGTTSVSSVNITYIDNAYAHCTVYNSASPSSGSVEYITSPIK